MSTLENNADIPLTEGTTSKNRLPFLVASLAGAGLLIALYFLWPYQHGHLEYRTSVIKGLTVLVSTSAGKEWLFCLAVPFIAALLVYLRRDRFRGVPIQGSNWALVPFVLALGLFWLGYKGDTRFLGFASAQLMVATLIIWFLGWQYMRLLFFPWLFLAFTWPFPPLEEMLAFPLRLFAAESSTVALNLFGIDCVREGTAVISSPDEAAGYTRGALFQLDVEQPCSGIRSLFSLLMISAFYGYLALPRSWQRLVLFLSAIPLAVLGNIVRMLLLAYGSVFFGTEFAVGEESPSTYHELSGIAVFVVALSGMFGICRLLESLDSGGKRRKKGPKPARAAEGAGPAPAPIPYWRSVFVAGMGAVILAACYFTPVSTALSAPGVKLDLPVRIGSFWGYSVPMSKREKDVFIEGVKLARMRYEGGNGQTIVSTVVQGGPEGRTLHRPEVCLPGQGWQVIGTEKIPVTLNDGSQLEATLLSIVRSQTTPEGQVIRQQAYNLYWYVGHDTTVASYHEHIAAGLLDSLFKNVNHRWSMVSIFSGLPPNAAGDPLAEEELLWLMVDMSAKVVDHVRLGDWP